MDMNLLGTGIDLLRSVLMYIIGNEILVNLIMIGAGIGAIMGVIMTAAMVLTFAERKVCGYMQGRIGPNRVGPYGILQSMADTLKLMSKEDIIPNGVDPVIWALPPLLLFTVSALVYALFPFETGAVLADVNVGLFLVMAISSQAVMPFLMGGYGSNSKYSLIGGMRIVAMMLSYEAPMAFALLGIVMMTGSMKLSAIVEAQAGGGWFIFLQPVAFIIYLITVTAETNRTPFDLVEGESEIIAGPFTEYSGMRWALFFLAEYANLLSASILTTILFLGGWSGPILPGIFWFWIKVAGMVFLFMWFRWTFPRTRIDQMLTFSWKVLLPLALANVLLTGVGIYIYRSMC